MKLNIKTICLSLVTLAATGTFCIQQHTSQSSHNYLALTNIEALTEDTEKPVYGCGRAAYQWDDAWYQNTVTFRECTKGCPHPKGTSPLYQQCD